MTANCKRKPEPLGKNFGRRNHAVVAVGAWVEVANPWKLGDTEVFTSAQIEEERMRQRHQDKEARLQQFQRDVRDRVREVHCEKRERQLQVSSQAVDLQQRILSRSHRGEMGATSRPKGQEIYRERNIQISSDGESQYEGGGDREGVENVFDPHQLNHLSQRIGNMIKMAKSELASRKLVSEKENVPGGRWGKSFTRDDLSMQQFQEGMPVREAIPQMERELLHGKENPYTDIVRDQPLYSVSDGVKLLCDEVPCEPVTSDTTTLGQMSEPAPSQTQTRGQRSKTVTFDPVVTADDDIHLGYENNLRPDRDRKVKERLGKKDGRRKSVREVVDVKPGVIVEEKKRQVREEVLMYRRLFMDMERENVQENRRKKQHSKRIQRLKKVKEEERLAIERQSEQATEPKDPETGLTEAELTRVRREDEREAEAQMERQKRKETKNRETKRYIQALRAQMKEKMDQQGVALPPLCPCGVTAWDCNPDTCANNCVFYKNPKAYAKALASLLNSSDLG